MIPAPSPSRPRARRAAGLLGTAALVAVAALGAAACAPRAGGMPVETLRLPPEPGPGYRIAIGDVLGIRVWNQESMSVARARVREDGRISVPFLHDVEVVGETPTLLALRLENSLRSFVQNPAVTVTVEEIRPLRVSVIGQVSRPGVYEVDRGAGVLAALAAAGGLTDYAHRDLLYVLRPTDGARHPAAPLRIRFTFGALTRADPAAAAFVLHQGDTVVVE
jgi:polysaccharide export outer membrane protein